MQDIRVAAVQMEHTAGDAAKNWQKITYLAEQAACQGARIIIFPECCVTGYWFLRKLSRDELMDLAEVIPHGPSSQAALQLASKLQAAIGVGLIERDGERLYNSYLLAMPNGEIVCHRKLHAFESDFITCGDRLTIVDTPWGCRVAILICYDNNIIENARMCALAGAEILIAPHQTGGCDSRSPGAMGLIDPGLWERRAEDSAALLAELRGDKGRGWLMRWLPSRAHDNGLFLIFANGIGVDDNEIRTGGAMILDPYGRILAEATEAADEVVVADLVASLQPSSTGARWLRARRPELYQPLTIPTGRERPTRQVRFE